MKKLLLTLIVSFAMCGSITAQYESHWPDFYYPTYQFQTPCVAAIVLDGEIVTAETPNWDALEVAFFVGEECRGAGVGILDYNAAVNYLYNGYVEEYEDPFPIIDGAPVYYDNTGEVVTVRMYDHASGIEYNECVVTYLGEPYTILTGDENDQGWFDPENPLFLNFTSPEPAYQTFTKDIVGYGDVTNARGFYLIASPIVEDVTPGTENGFYENIEDDTYDLYFFDGSQEGKEWRNFHEGEDSHGPFNLVNGKGYLYASQDSTTLIFTGTPYSGDGVVELEYSDAPFGGWNLVGNPFAEQALPNREYLILNTGEEGDDFIPGEGGVEAMEGIMVYAEAEGETVTFIPSNGEGGEDKLTINLTKSCVRGTVDRAIVKFGEGRTLPKFQMNPNHTKVYIPQDGTDYAVVRAPEMGEMPVNFKAETNGSYTMSFGSENVTFSYLHLIDNLTGADVDLLATPSYTFDASTTDYASRFRLVFATGDNSDGDSFAFFSNGSFVVSNEGEATLQVIDVMGRILKSENISGCASVKVNAASGVYMLRLVNGNDMKVQKVVVE